MKWFKKTFIHSPIRYIIAAGLALSLVLVYLILNGFNALTYYYDACFASGMIVIFIGFFSLISYFGGFDFFGYAFSAMRGREKRKHKDYYEYATAKQETRSKQEYTFVPYFVVGASFIIIGLLILLVIRIFH